MLRSVLLLSLAAAPAISVAAPPVTLLPPPGAPAPAPLAQVPELPWEADWEFRRDFKVDGALGGEGTETFRLRQYDFGAGGKGRTFQGNKDVFDVNVELIRPRGGGAVVLLRQSDDTSAALYTAALVKDGLYRGTWHDHKGRGGDWELKFTKGVEPVGVFGTTIEVTHPGINIPNGVSRINRSGFVVSALDERGKLVKQVTSGEGGRWHLSLPPGKYTVAFKTPDRLMSEPKAVVVEVKEGSSQRIDAEGHLHAP